MNEITPKQNTTIAYTDGACKNNPGSGGWGAYLTMADGKLVELYGGEHDTTNNKMEMMATIQAIHNSPAEHLLEIWTDSSYVKNGITNWIDGWKRNGWKTASKKPVKNQELWQQLDELNQSRNISWNWIKGHAGHFGNEKADMLANKGVESLTSNSNQQNNTVRVSQNDWLDANPLGFFEDDEVLEDEYYETSHGFDDASHTDNSQNNTDTEAYIQSTSVDSSASNTNNAHQHSSALNNGSGSLNHTIDTETAYQQDSENAFDGDTSRANPNFRPLLPFPKHKSSPHRQLIMDTETTGLDPNNGDRVIEVGIVELVNRKFTGEKLHVYTNPMRSMDDEVIRVHGITEAFLADKPTFDKVAKQVYDFMDGAEIIAHNASFDMNFLTMEFAKVGLGDFAQRVKVTDTLAMAKQQYPGQKNTLDALVRRLNVGKQDRTFHGALLDSEILAEVYLAMTGGQVTLAIDEESDEDGVGSHASFSDLAQLLVHDSSLNTQKHQEWLKEIAKKNPIFNERW